MNLKWKCKCDDKLVKIDFSIELRMTQENGKIPKYKNIFFSFGDRRPFKGSMQLLITLTSSLVQINPRKSIALVFIIAKI